MKTLEERRQYHKEYMARIESCRTSPDQSISNIIHSAEYMQLKYEYALKRRKKYLNQETPKRKKMLWWERREKNKAYMKEYNKMYRAKKKAEKEAALKANEAEKVLLETEERKIA